jgi:hypothetical protein
MTADATRARIAVTVPERSILPCKREPEAMMRDLPGRRVFSADLDTRKPAGTLTATVFLPRGPLSR